MAPSDLVGLQREPMPAASMARLVDDFAVAIAGLYRLFDLVSQFDGEPMPAGRAEFYAVSGDIRAVERQLARFVKHCAFHLAWELDIAEKPPLTPRFPGMIPKR